MVKDKKLSKEEKLGTIRYFDATLNLGLSEEKSDASTQLPIISLESLSAELQTLIQQREKARAEKRWGDADTLRAQINLHGYLVEDSPQGTKITKSI